MAKKFAMIFGWVFVVIGILGFINNPIVGSAPGAIFAADTAHNLVHLISGVVFLWVAYGAAEKAGMVLKVFGFIYLIVAIFGFFSTSGRILDLITTNTADNWLHLVLGILFLVGGMSKDGAMQASPMPGQQM